MTNSVIEKLFGSLIAIYPYKFAGQFADRASLELAKSNWFLGLQDLSETQIEKGLHDCRIVERDWPPSLPEFRKLCLPTKKDLGILNKEEALQKFLKNDLSNPVLQMVRQRIDIFGFRNSSAVKANKMFYECYTDCVDKYLKQAQTENLLEHNA